MSIASWNVVPENLRTSIIRVFSYQDKNLQGAFFNPYYGAEMIFGNLTRLLLLMEDMMDRMDIPQASIRSRRFGKGPKLAESATMTQQLLPRPNQEAIATFEVKVLFRQGASWQGKLVWVEEDEERTFRSALELVKLLDSALPQPVPQKQNTDGEAAGTGWPKGAERRRHFLQSRDTGQRSKAKQKQAEC